MFEKIASKLGGQTTEDIEFLKYRNKSNITHGKIFTKIVIAFEIIFLILALIGNANSFRSLFKYNFYTMMYLLLIVSSLIYFSVLKRYREDRKEIAYHKNLYRVTLGYSYLFLLWGMAITFADQALYSNMNALIINLIAISSFMYIAPRDAVKMFGIVAVIFFMFISRYQQEMGILIGHYINGPVVFCFVLMTSIVLYNGYKNNYIKGKALNEQIIMNEQMNRELSKVNDELEVLSVKDSLTGLANRRGLDQFIQRMERVHLSKDMSLTVMIIDIDYFKQYNDHYGHLLGDEVIVRISEVLMAYSTSLNDYVVRFGGDEFLFISVGRSEQYSQELAENIRSGVEALSIVHEHSGAGQFITTSIGLTITTVGNHEWVFEQIANADAALYDVKKKGRNRVGKYTDRK